MSGFFKILLLAVAASVPACGPGVALPPYVSTAPTETYSAPVFREQTAPVYAAPRTLPSSPAPLVDTNAGARARTVDATAMDNSPPQQPPVAAVPTTPERKTLPPPDSRVTPPRAQGAEGSSPPQRMQKDAAARQVNSQAATAKTSPPPLESGGKTVGMIFFVIGWAACAIYLIAQHLQGRNLFDVITAWEERLGAPPRPFRPDGPDVVIRHNGTERRFRTNDQGQILEVHE